MKNKKFFLLDWDDNILVMPSKIYLDKLFKCDTIFPFNIINYWTIEKKSILIHNNKYDFKIKIKSKSNQNRIANITNVIHI